MADQVKLFVGGLPDSFGEEELRELFSPHGVVREAVILASKSTSGQKCGFVCYQARTAQEMAAAAIATLSDRHCPPGVDKPIQVSVAKNSAAAGKACGRRDSSWHAAAAFPSGGPPSSLVADGACGGLVEAAASSMACPPQQPGASYCGAAASPMNMAYLPPSPPCDAAVGPGVGMGAAGMGGVGGALPWAPSPPQFVPRSQPPPHGHPTVQENPAAGSSGMPVKLFVGTAARPDAPSLSAAEPSTACTSSGSAWRLRAAPGGSGR